MEDLDAVVQGKLDADTDFNASLESLSDEEKDEAIKTKRSEILNQEYSTLKADKDKSDQIAKDQKIRAEKAEQDLKKNKTTQPVEDKSELTEKDRIALIRTNVHEDDLDEVLEYSHLKKISVTEALKSSVVKAILAEKEEFRKTAEATSTQKSKPVNQKITDEAILEKASKGDIPEKGSEEAERLFWAKRGGKK